MVCRYPSCKCAPLIESHANMCTAHTGGFKDRSRSTRRQLPAFPWGIHIHPNHPAFVRTPMYRHFGSSLWIVQSTPFHRRQLPNNNTIPIQVVYRNRANDAAAVGSFIWMEMTSKSTPAIITPHTSLNICNTSDPMYRRTVAHIVRPPQYYRNRMRCVCISCGALEQTTTMPLIISPCSRVEHDTQSQELAQTYLNISLSFVLMQLILII